MAAHFAITKQENENAKVPPGQEDLTNPLVRPTREGFNDEAWWWCKPCGLWKWSGPAHTASTHCKSGKRPHCTCDTCF